MDECQSWANKAEALASYARQAGDDSLRKTADRIQARAIERCGELLKAIEPSKGGDSSLFIAHEGTHTSVTRTQAAKEAGLSEFQKVTALRTLTVLSLGAHDDDEGSSECSHKPRPLGRGN